MSSKLRRRWIFYLVASVLAANSVGCINKKHVKTPGSVVREQEQLISNINQLTAQNHCPEATAACNDFLKRFPQSPVLDHALFQCGILAASEQNPQKNYNQALNLLRRISTETPASHYAPNAKIVALLIESIGQLQAAYAKQGETIMVLQSSEVRLVDLFSQLQASYAKQVETIKSLQGSEARQKQTIRDLQNLQSQQMKTIQDLQSEIEVIKRIDLSKRP